jgi:hypothetical protein
VEVSASENSLIQTTTTITVTITVTAIASTTTTATAMTTTTATATATATTTTTVIHYKEKGYTCLSYLVCLDDVISPTIRQIYTVSLRRGEHPIDLVAVPD